MGQYSPLCFQRVTRKGQKRWDWHGNRAHWPRDRSGTSSHRNRCRSGSCTRSHCVAGCASSSATQYIADSEDVVLLHEPGRYPVAYFPRGDVQPGVLTRRRARHPTSRPRRDAVVHRRRRWTRGQPCGVGVPRAAGICRRVGRTRGVRVAGDGRLLRRRRTHRRTRGGLLPSHRHPVHLTPSHGARRRPGDRGHPSAGRPLRIRIRAALVRAARRCRRIGPGARRRPDLLPLQGIGELLHHRDTQASGVVVHQRVAGSGAGEQPALLRTRQGRRLPRRPTAPPRAGPDP